MTIKGIIPDFGANINAKEKLEDQYLTTKMQFEANPLDTSKTIASLLEKGTSVSHEWNLPNQFQVLKPGDHHLKDDVHFSTTLE